MNGFQRLKKRADFLKAARGRKWNTEHFTLQILKRTPADEAPPRFGFTVTNKVGIATVRNRIRRRLREAVRLIGSVAARPGHDYVLIGRKSAVKAPFERILADLHEALVRTGKGPPRRPDAGDPGSAAAVRKTEPGNG
ncbi:MAG: ribonuclease P protein component [Hyphomicrobiales bacterium]|nr:ribonuclease P protein component [Hyphomicrobiales bacterium]